MRINAAVLKSKGWGQEEIAKASTIIDRAETKKHSSVILLDNAVYWFGLATAIVGNLVAAAFLMPFVAFLPGATVYFIIAITGVCFGLLFTVLVRDIEKAGKGHHILAAILIPLTGIASFVSMVHIANSKGLGAVDHSALGISLAYVVFFLVPYIFFLSEERFEWFEAGALK